GVDGDVPGSVRQARGHPVRGRRTSQTRALPHPSEFGLLVSRPKRSTLSRGLASARKGVSRMRTHLFVAVRSIVPAVVLCVGCASIESFSANPRTACAGDAVTVTWAAVGDVTIGSEPAVADVGSKASAGSQQFIVDRDTRFTLKASRLFSCKRTEADVVVAPPAREYGGVAACSSAERAIALTVPLGERQVSSTLKV